MSKKNKPALGRGLNSLLGGGSVDIKSQPSRELSPEIEQKTEDGQNVPFLTALSLEVIVPNPDQPRTDFDSAKLQELADSIAHIGLVQPITVRPIQEGKYLIVAGERRYRASKLAGLEAIPAYIRPEDSSLLELALTENIQRENLNSIEVALAYKHLLETSGYTQEILASRLGKSRASISNHLRLLGLPSTVQMGLREGLLEMGHAKALLQVKDPERLLELYQLTLAEQLSVRDVERLARAINEEPQEDEPLPDEQKPKRPKLSLPEEYRVLEQQLSQVFSSKVALKYSDKGKGSIQIPFANEDELERLILLLEKLQG